MHSQFLIITTFILFVVEAIWHKNLIAAGLACWVATSVHF